VKAVVVNKKTEFVDNIILVNSLSDPIGPDHVLVAIDKIEKEMLPEEKELYNVIKELDPNYYDERVMIERPIYIGKTKWNNTSGFYEGE